MHGRAFDVGSNKVMKTFFYWRRTFVGGVAGMIAASSVAPKRSVAQSDSGISADNEATVRRYYKLWESPDWAPFEGLLATDFTFTSAAGDDHISKAEFKRQCWDTQKDHIARFDLLRLVGSGDETFVMYKGLTKNDKPFRNVELVRAKDGKVKSIECYFGDKDSFASAVSTRMR